MKELICKADIVEEIEKIYNEDYKFLPSDVVESVQDFKDDLLIALNTIEVKEVDLEKEIKSWLDRGHITDTRYDDYDDNDIESTAKHFFELGMQQSKNDNNYEEKK